MSVDESKNKGDFWITGSQVFRLMKNVSESLAGRVGIMNLLGLSDAEIYQEPSEPFQPDAAKVADEMQFYNFMTVVAAHTSKPVVYEELANATGISAPTAKKWLSILVSSHIIALVQPYHNNALKRVVKMPLLHFLDTGLAAYLRKL